MSEVEVAAGLVFRDGKLLITLRHNDVHLGGLWEFPGGKREPNETFEECLHRELREELGIEVDVLELLETARHTYPEKTVHLRFFRCAWKRNEAAPLGCADLRWTTAKELPNYKFPEADTELVRLLQDRQDIWA
jgi:mutator protein MutT